MKSAYFRHQATKILGALYVKLGYGEIENFHFSFRSDIIFLSHFWGKKSLDFA